MKLTAHQINISFIWGISMILSVLNTHLFNFNAQSALKCFAFIMIFMHLTPLLGKTKENADIFGYAKQKIPFLMAIVSAIGRSFRFIMAYLFVVVLATSSETRNAWTQNDVLLIAGLPLLIIFLILLCPVIFQKVKTYKNKMPYTLPIGVRIQSRNDVWHMIAWACFWTLLAYMFTVFGS